MSASLQERRERVERRLEALLLGLDETVRQVYESLLERGADYDELSPEKSVARLEGFHDYIITREETGVAHPTFSDYLEAKRKFGDEMLSFGTGRRSSLETEAPVEEAPEEVTANNEEEEVVLDEFVETTPPVTSNTEVEEQEKETSFLADLNDLQEVNTESDEVEIAEDEPVIDDEEEVEGEEIEPASEEVVIDDNDDVEAEEVEAEDAPAEDAPVEAKPSVWEDDDEEVVIIADAEETPAVVSVSNETKAFEGFVAPEKKEEAKAPEASSASVAGRINDRVIIEQDFSTKLGGYSIDEVDDYLDELANFFKTSHSAASYKAKIEDIKEKGFNKKNFKKGFAINEVDDFLDTVILELENRAVESK